jgi:amino acid adenylation domain-containing protein
MKAALVQDFLTHSAQRKPEKIALVCDGLRLSYAELEMRTNQLANALIASGLRRGDRVALFLPNILEQVVAIFAILKAGAVFVVINHSTKEDKLVYILQNSSSKMMVTWTPQVEMLKRIIPLLPNLELVLVAGGNSTQVTHPKIQSFDGFVEQAPVYTPPRVNIDLDLACLIYTSGSTGDPKGVMSDHSNVAFAVRSITTYLQNVENDIILNALPLSFDYGLYQLLMSVFFGGTLVLEKGFVYPAMILKKIEEERITGFPGVPTMYSVILNMDITGVDLSSLRYMTNTAAALSQWHIDKISENFPGVRFYSMYGLTETKRTLYLPPEDLKRKPDSVGIPIPGTEAWIEDSNGNRLGPNQTGELVIRGRHVMRGYWQNPAATAERYRPGLYPGERLCYSGDLFKQDEEGYFYFIARRDDIIKSRGEKVAPKEVENALYKLSGVQEAAVIGVPDAILGEAVKAFVVLTGVSYTENEILRHCRQNLEDFMVPKMVEIRSELPKTSSGKIKKTDLS